MTNETTQQSPNGSMNVEDQTNLNSSNDKENHILEPLDDTGLSTLGNEDDGYVVTILNYVITEKFKTKKELEEYVYGYPYKFLINLIHVMIEINKKQTNQTKSK